MCGVRVSGVAVISNAGGHTRFSATAARNALESLKYIRGQTIGLRRINNARAQFCATIGMSALKNFRDIWQPKISTSQSTSIAYALKRRAQTGRVSASRPLTLSVRFGSSALHQA